MTEKINVRRHGEGFMAWLGDNEAKWEYGKSRQEAIGNIIISYFPEMIGTSQG